MVNIVQYNGELIPIEVNIRKLDDIVDVWLRRNPRESVEDMNEADEVYTQFNINEAPSMNDLESNFDIWFEKIDEMTNKSEPNEKRMAELESLIYTILGVTENV